jgi:hypothetical protein
MFNVFVNAYDCVVFGAIRPCIMFIFLSDFLLQFLSYMYLYFKGRVQYFSSFFDELKLFYSACVFWFFPFPSFDIDK